MHTTTPPSRDSRAIPSLLRGPALAIGAAILAALATAVVLGAFSLVQFPAFGNSNVLQALTVVGQVLALAVMAAGILAARAAERSTDRGSPGLLAPHTMLRAAKLALPTGAALLVATTLGIPLAATRLYLMGVSVDQEFRTQFLSRSATSLGMPDMAYADLPSFYPSGWFWLGGRLANLAGLDGWAAYKPWAIGSMALAAALVTVLWTRLLRTDLGALAALVSVAVVLAYGSPEPYGAVVALFAPPVLLLAWHAVNPSAALGRAPRLGRAAALGTALYLGISACFYTLYTALLAATVILMAVVATMVRVLRARQLGTRQRTAQSPEPDAAQVWQPLIRLAAIGGGALLIALPVWAPYLLALTDNPPADSGTAFHYLPDSGAVLPLPMFAGGIVGWLCLVGMMWILARCATSRRAQALGLGVAAVYLWCLASMAMTALGSTLLGFRTEVVLIAELSVAGVFGLADVARLAVQASGRRSTGHSLSAERPAFEAKNRRRRLTTVLGVLAAAAIIAFTQSIPGVLGHEIRVAYTDTDGKGLRADRYPPGAESHYPSVDAVILAAYPGRERTDLVVASTADGFLAYHPYLAYQAVTSHYANPLGRYSERNGVMESWGEASSPAELYRLVTGTPWRRPDALITRSTKDGYTVRLAEDTYPNNPNVRRFAVTIPAAAVSGPQFELHEVGPFTVIIVR